jgi:hypothetical protein
VLKEVKKRLPLKKNYFESDNENFQSAKVYQFHNKKKKKKKKRCNNNFSKKDVNSAGEHFIVKSQLSSECKIISLSRCHSISIFLLLHHH